MLTDVLPEVRPEPVSAPDFGPRVLRFTDGVSETTNSVMTPGGVFSIIGDCLRIDGRQPEPVGLYLRAEDGTETKVDVLLRKDPTYLSGQLPDTLASGTYQLLVKTQIGASNRFVADMRTSISSFSLTVQ